MFAHIDSISINFIFVIMYTNISHHAVMAPGYDCPGVDIYCDCCPLNAAHVWTGSVCENDPDCGSVCANSQFAASSVQFAGLYHVSWYFSIFHTGAVKVERLQWTRRFCLWLEPQVRLLLGTPFLVGLWVVLIIVFICYWNKALERFLVFTGARRRPGRGQSSGGGEARCGRPWDSRASAPVRSPQHCRWWTGGPCSSWLLWMLAEERTKGQFVYRLGDGESSGVSDWSFRVRSGYFQLQ